MHDIKVIAPATVSNVTCGFDCFGFALEEPYDELTLRMIPERSLRIRHLDRYGLPSDPQKNVAGVALFALMDSAGLDHGFELEINKGIKPGSGIGSSAATACAAVVAANRALGDHFSKSELIEFALEGEQIAAGSRVADNVAACMFGGFTLVRSTAPLDIVSLVHPTLHATVLHPQVEMKTTEVRGALPRDVPLAQAIQQWANVGGVVAALAGGDYSLLGRSMQDIIVEPHRRTLVPKFDEIKASCLDAGAIGGGISGSGPSIFMLSETGEQASNLANVMRTVFDPTGIEFNIYVSPVGGTGARVI